MNRLIKLTAVALFCISFSYGAEECASCGDACECAEVCACEQEPRAPIGVMGDHVHHKGGWMVSYRYMFMRMDGVEGDLSGYMMKPVDMDMQMHMLGAMITPLNNLTLGLMVPYKKNEMNMTMGPMNIPMTMESEGFGDLKLGGTYRVWSSTGQQLLLNLALSVPTGSVDEKGSNGMVLPYPMQLGSGSYGLIPGITYTGQVNAWGWGAQANGTFYLNENDRSYTLGNRYGLQAWGSRDLCAVSAVSLRMKGSRVENIEGADPALNPMMTPLADPNLRAGTRVDLLAGIDWRPKGKVSGLRLALEGGAPIYQNLTEPQLKTAWMLIAGAQVSF